MFPHGGCQVGPDYRVPINVLADIESTVMQLEKQSMSSPPLITTKFWIGGNDLDIAEITRAVGVEPTGVWHQQREDLRKRCDLDDSGWWFGFEKRPLFDTNEAVNEVLEKLWPQREKIRSYLKLGKGRATLVVNFTISDDRPEYNLSAETMEKLAYLRCEFGLDIFDYSE